MTRFENRKAGDRPCGHRGRHRDMRRKAMHMRAGHQHGGHRRRRALKHGDLRYLLLQLITEAPRHGYDLIKAIEERTGGAYAPSPGVIYPALEVLQDLGWARADSDDGKKTFHVTDEGEVALKDAKETLAGIDERLAGMASGRAERGPGEVRVLLRRLHHGVREKLKREAASDETRKSVEAVLTDALAKIEAL